MRITQLTKGQEIKYKHEGATLCGRVVRPTPDSDNDIIVQKYSPLTLTYTEYQAYVNVKDIVTDSCELKPWSPEITSEDSVVICSNEVASAKLSTPKQENETMNEVKASRSVVNVTLIDNDAGLKPENSVVADLGQFVVEGNNYDHLKQRILMDTKLDIAGKLKAHNDLRQLTTDLEVLKRTGNKVKLQPVEIFQLEWSFK